jgi:hypothetical protein
MRNQNPIISHISIGPKITFPKSGSLCTYRPERNNDINYYMQQIRQAEAGTPEEETLTWET